jgi:hypothetical protein
MYKTIILIFLVFQTLNAYTQSRISIAAHPQFVWLASDDINFHREGPMMGISTALSIDFFFAEKYAFSTGLSIDNLGGKISYSNDITYTLQKTPYLINQGAVIKKRLQYLGIPFGLKLKTQEIGYSTYFINPGFTPMINLRSRAEGGSVLPKTDFSDETRLFNMNYFVSGGMEYSLGGSTSVFGGMGYSAGFMDVTSRKNNDVHTRSLYFILGILF